MTYENGYKYVGEWKDGKKYGNGTYTWVSGNKNDAVMGSSLH